MRRHVHLSRRQITRRTPDQLFRRNEAADIAARSKRAPERRDIATAPSPITLDEFGPNAFAGYQRDLTADGGIHIAYTNADTHWRHTIRRLLVWTASTGFSAWLLSNHSPISSHGGNFLCLLAMSIGTWLIVRRPVKIFCTVEIRPDCMVLDGKDVFWLEVMGGNRPTFEAEDENSMVLAGVYGTRFVEYLKVLGVALYPSVLGFKKIEDWLAQSFEPINRHGNDGMRFKPQVPGID